MRRLLLFVIIGAAIGGALWALWPSTTWPRAFCDPVLRVTGADVIPISASFTHPERALSSEQLEMVSALRIDVRLAADHAPTSALKAELDLYESQLRTSPTILTVSNAFSQFDEHARTQLRACGVTPLGR